MRRFWPIFLIMISGCGDPETRVPARVEARAAEGDRLEIGQRVLLATDDVGFDGRPVTGLLVESEDQESPLKDIEGGTEARVVRDDGKLGDPGRRVTIHLLGGKWSGIAGRVERRDCHPIK